MILNIDAHCTHFEEPNTHVAYLDFGMPGMLPMLNEDCLDQAIRCSLALNGQIPSFIKFDRKHYVYPDLP
jgi:aspartyl-tRNA(Asn)/glutamyl-tRNA(Gln) amidotransferase subunit B